MVVAHMLEGRITVSLEYQIHLTPLILNLSTEISTARWRFPISKNLCKFPFYGVILRFPTFSVSSERFLSHKPSARCGTYRAITNKHFVLVNLFG